MKKLILIPLSFMFFTFSSCEKDESLDPLPTVVAGQYVRLDITKKVLAFEHINETEFGGILTTPGNNVAKYELFVRRTNAQGVISANYVLLKTITTFPVELKITPQDLATALNLQLSDLNSGDKFRFLGYSYNANGKIADYNSLSTTVKIQPGMKQAYKFVTGLENDINLGNFFDNYGL